jgi:hypothetical protein
MRGYRLGFSASAAVVSWEFIGHHYQVLSSNQPCRLPPGDNSSRIVLFLKPLFYSYELKKNRYNKYTQIAARAVRQSLKENERLAAEKRGLTAQRYQHWEGGKGGEQVAFPSLSSESDELANPYDVVGASLPAS